ncbi:sugar transporter [Lichtheimia corymbifera JMRC:FSU:9682]|uniref:Sugar transporter n=1 Tax=Lichtheimia corymbifera JMRC:FSU:9682 TaxID=1263082 RepID=A0A068RUC7_9FUNG|nr:sugar transporter [Lichtheimia corymbifera JMRC:FSU:9682]
MAPVIAVKQGPSDPNIKSEAGAIIYMLTQLSTLDDFGVTSSVIEMEPFQQYFAPLTPGIKGALNSLMACGAVFGCLIAGWMSDRWGRRDSITLSALLFIVGGVLQTASVHIAMQLVGRFISGLSVGACSFLSPMYNAELAPKEIRGRLVGFQQFMIDTGMLVSGWLGFGTNYLLSDWSWRTPYLVQIAPAIVLALAPFILPRSPRWLVEKGRIDEAHRVLARIHGKGDLNHPYVLHELQEIKDNVELENNVAVDNYWQMLKDRKNSRVLWVGCSIAVFQQLTGANVIMYYAPLMFKQAGLKGDLSLLANGIDYIVMVIFCIPGMWLVDKLGRVKLMIIGSVGMCCGFFIMAGLYGGCGYVEWSEADLSHVINMSNHPEAANAVIAWAPVAWIYIAEIFPLRIRSKGFAFASALLWCANILVGQVTPILMDKITYGTYIPIYGVVGLIMLAWIILFAPEPKGLSLEEMEVIFHGPIIVTNLDYDAYLAAHKEDIEQKRAEVEAAAGGKSTKIEANFDEKA